MTAKPNLSAAFSHLAGAFLALLLAASPAGASLPATNLITAPMLSPTSAWGYYGNPTTHTNSAAAWTTLQPPEITAMARSLGADRLSKGQITAVQYAQNVFDYVRNNIAVEFRFGLSKGARGALIDLSATPFDQAELVVKLLRQGGVSASYQVGTITLTAQQFGLWSGLVTSLNQSTQSFTVSALAACQFLADGGIPAVVNSSSDCTSFHSGDALTSVTLGHIWVSANGLLYDPSFKQNVLQNGIDIATAMGCGGSPPSCGSTETGAMMQNAAQGTYGTYNAPTLSNLNESFALSQMNSFATSLQGVITGGNRFAKLQDIVGGKVPDLTFAPVPAATLPYPSSVQYTWAGDVPDKFRTQVTLTIFGTPYVFYGDELAGRRLREFTDLMNDIWVDDIPLALTILNNNDPLIAIDHPYAASNGTYADDSGSFASNRMASFVVQLGEATPSTVAYYQHLESADPSPFRGIGADNTCDDTRQGDIKTRCRHDELSAMGANVLAQQSEAAALIGPVTRTQVMHHHRIGVVTLFIDNGHSSQATDANRINIQATESVQAAGASATTRLSAFRTDTYMSSVAEGSVAQQNYDTWEPQSGALDFVLANRNALPLIYVSAGNMSAYLSGNTSPGNLQAFADAGYDTIITNPLGCFFKQTEDWPCINDYPDLEISTSSVGLLLDSTIKGGADFDSASVQAMTKPAYDLSVPEAKSAKLTRGVVENATGAFTLTPPPDIVSGAGQFPLSLPFQRYYSSADDVREIAANTYRHLDNFPPPNESFVDWQYSGPDSISETRLGGGWTYNYLIGAKITADPERAYGRQAAIEATSAIAAIYTLNDMLQNPSFSNWSAASFVDYWFSQQIRQNTVVVTKGNQTLSFAKLPDGTFNPLRASPDRLVQNGSRGNLVFNQTPTPHYDYSGINFKLTDKDGSVLTLSPSTKQQANQSWFLPLFQATSWTFPTGASITFQYGSMSIYEQDQSTTYSILQSVSNNFGRSLTFTTQASSGTMYLNDVGWRITAVTDETGRFASYALSGCPLSYANNGAGDPIHLNSYAPPLAAQNFLACNTMSVTSPKLETVQYSYAAGADSPDPAVLVRPNYRLRRIFYPTNPTTPFQTIAYDDLFRPATVKDANGNTAFFYAGGLNEENWKHADKVDALANGSTDIFDWRGENLQSIDELGNVTKRVYDDIGRPTQTIYPEGNYETRAYDIRSNLLSLNKYPKPGSAEAIAGQVLTASATYEEGPTTFNCAHAASCNRPASTQDERGYFADYQWSSSSGLPSKIVTGLNSSGQCQLPSAPNCPEIDLGYLPYGGVQLLQSKTEKISGTASTETDYDYDGTNKFVLKTVRVDAGTGKLNLTTSYTFDLVGNIIQIVRPGASTEDSHYVWDADRRLTMLIRPDPDGSSGPQKRRAAKYTYDADSELTQIDRGTVTDAAGDGFVALANDIVGFDAMGNKTSETLTAPGLTTPLNVTQYSYDADERLLCTAVRTIPASFGSLSSNACALTMGYTEPYGDDRITKLIYDAAGQQRQEVRGFNSASQQVYETVDYTPNGRQKAVADADAGLAIGSYPLDASQAYPHQTNYAYDGFDRIATTTFADGTTELVPFGGYDAAGNALMRTNRFGQTLQYAYDPIGRLATKVVPAVPGISTANTVTWGYDLIGEVTSLSDTQSNSLTNTYDGAKRQTSATRSAPGLSGSQMLTYQYDADSHRTALIWPDNYCAVYQYNAAEQPSAILEGSASGSTCATTSTLATFGYDQLDDPSDLHYGSTLADVASTWDVNDDLLVIQHSFLPSGGVSFTDTYSPAHQVASSTISNDAYAYVPGVFTDTYAAANGLNQYTAVNGGAASGQDCQGTAQQFSYDCNGNLTGDGVWTFGYDPENRLMKANASGFAVTYQYDPQGRRVRKNVNSTTTFFLDSNDDEVGEYSGSGSILRRYIPGMAIDRSIAMIDYTIAGNPKTFFHRDKTGSVIAMSDTTGAAVQGPITYDPFGNASVASGLPYQFDGMRYDGETGCYYDRARYYCPGIGRFLQTDSVGYKDDIDWYTYVGNDPTDKTDPSGKDAVYCNHDGCNVVRDDTGDTKFYKWQNRYDKNGKQTGYWKYLGSNNTTNTWDGHLDIEAFKAAVQAAMAAAPGNGGNRNGQQGQRPKLKQLHSDEAMNRNLSSRNFWSKKSNEEIIDSLKPGEQYSLKVKPDGTVMDGNMRIQILRERGVDVDSLPREPYGGQAPGD